MASRHGLAHRVAGQLPSGAFMWPWGGGSGCLQAETLPLQQDPPAGMQLGFGVPIPPKEVMAGPRFTLCGHCRLRPADSEQRERVWSLLRGLLETYCRLREEDQSFAVEVLCPGVSLAFGASQGCEAVWSPGMWGRSPDQGLWGSSLGQWRLTPAPEVVWLGLGASAAIPPCLPPPGCGAADPPSAVRAVHRVPGAAGGAVHQHQPRAWRGRGGPCLPPGAHQAAGLLLQVRSAPPPSLGQPLILPAHLSLSGLQPQRQLHPPR